MCLIIFTPDLAKAKIHPEVLKKAFQRNNDGAGFAYVKDKKVVIEKPFFKFKDFYAAYQKHPKKGALLIHFRWATCGENNGINTQPIPVVSDKLVMAHNGVFSALSIRESGISDSVFLSYVIRNLKWELPFNKSQYWMLTGLCDNSSKLVFLDHKGNHTIINEKAGSWKDGAWYSDDGNTYDYVMNELKEEKEKERRKVYDNDNESTSKREKELQELIRQNQMRIGSSSEYNDWHRQMGMNNHRMAARENIIKQTCLIKHAPKVDMSILTRKIKTPDKNTKNVDPVIESDTIQLQDYPD